MTYFVAKTYYHRVYCNDLQRLTFVAIKVYCNKMKVIATKNFIAINLFSCSATPLQIHFSLPTKARHLSLSLSFTLHTQKQRGKWN